MQEKKKVERLCFMRKRALQCVSQGTCPYVNLTRGIERYVDMYFIRMHPNIPFTIPYVFAFLVVRHRGFRSVHFIYIVGHELY